MISCPHCQAPCIPDAAFCGTCGKAVLAGTGGPQIVGSAAFASTSIGRTLQAEQLLAASRKAFGALMLVAVMQTIFSIIVLILLNSTSPMPTQLESLESARGQVAVLAVIMFGIATIFFGLAFWARRSPFPAAIAGLVVFLTVHLLDALADPAAIGRGFILKLIIIVMLARAISAGAKHRVLSKARAAEMSG